MKLNQLFFKSAANFVLIFALFTACSNNESTEESTELTTPEVAQPTQEELIALGSYKVMTMGCHDCHSPKMMTPEGPVLDPDRLLSGHPSDETLVDYDPSLVQPGNWYLMGQGLTAFVGPWGTSFSANLTSDETGIGNWTEEQFKIALTEGWFKGVRDSRKLLPPMPWQNFIDLTDEDIHAIYTYLQSTNPVYNVVPAAVPPKEG